MDLTTKEVEEFISEVPPTAEFIHNFDMVCQQDIPQFEIWVEILFHKLTREKDSIKLLNIASNLSKLKHGEKVRQIFYNTVLSDFRKGAEDDFFHIIFGRPEAYKHIAEYLTHMPIHDIQPLVTRLIGCHIFPERLYIDILSHTYFYPIDKFNIIFNPISNEVKTKILISSIYSNNNSILNRINLYFQEHLIYSNDLFNHYMWNDTHPVVAALASTDTFTLVGTLSEFAKYIFERANRFPLTIERLVIKAADIENLWFVTKVAGHISKRKLLELLQEHASETLIKSFLNQFKDDPELEQLILFS